MDHFELFILWLRTVKTLFVILSLRRPSNGRVWKRVRFRGQGSKCAFTSLIGATLGAGRAGAGGATAACPLQGRFYRNVGPPQVGVATTTQTQQSLNHVVEILLNPLAFPQLNPRARCTCACASVCELTWPVWDELQPEDLGQAHFQESSSGPKLERWRLSSEEP